jgi:hypothetical protein
MLVPNHVKPTPGNQVFTKIIFNKIDITHTPPSHLIAIAVVAGPEVLA